MKSPQEDVTAQSLQEDGWEVFNTNDGFPDLFCFKDGRVKLVEVKKDGDPLRYNQQVMISSLRKAGVLVEVTREILLVKTTLELSEGMHKIAKHYAVEHNMKLSALVEEGLKLRMREK